MNKLKQIVDKEAYTKIMDGLAGETVYFPKSGMVVNREVRNNNIRRDYYAGISFAKLSKKYGLSESRIHKIVYFEG